MCCAMSSIATRFSAPRGTTMSAWLFDGPMKVSYEGLTNCSYLVVVVVMAVAGGWQVGVGARRGQGRRERARGRGCSRGLGLGRRRGASRCTGVARVGGGRWAGAGGGALLQDAVEVAAALGHVAPDAPREAHVRVGVDEDLHVEAVAQALVVQREDAWRPG